MRVVGLWFLVDTQTLPLLLKSWDGLSLILPQNRKQIFVNGRIHRDSCVW